MVNLQMKYEEEIKIKEEMEEAAIEDAPLLVEEVPIEEEEVTSTDNRRRCRVWKRGEDVSGKVWKRGGKKKRWRRSSSRVYKKEGKRRKWWRTISQTNQSKYSMETPKFSLSKNVPKFSLSKNVCIPNLEMGQIFDGLIS